MTRNTQNRTAKHDLLNQNKTRMRVHNITMNIQFTTLNTKFFIKGYTI